MIEEAHRLLKNTGEGSDNLETANVRSKAVTTFVDMLAEIRAFGQGVIVVDQVPARLNSNVIKGTAAKVVHRLLAEDDRRMVGSCMGLNDEQIADLALLETGQCVVHQDCQRKAFLCGVELNLAHESGSQPKISQATVAFKEEHRTILDPLALPKNQGYSAFSDVDAEDYVFCASLHKVMVAAPFSVQSEFVNAIGHVTPSRYASKQLPWQTDTRWPWLWLYWGQISDEVWAFYSGEYRDFLAYRSAGWDLLRTWASNENLETTLSAFAEVAKTYTGLPRPGSASAGSNTVANSYGQLLTREETIVAIRDRFRTGRLGKDDHSTLDRLAGSIASQIDIVLPPPPYNASEALRCGVLDAIIQRLRCHPDTAIALAESVKRNRAQGGSNA